MIVVDGGLSIGMGHLVRMRQLARKLLACGYAICFYTNNQLSYDYLKDEAWSTTIQPSHKDRFIIDEVTRICPRLIMFDILDVDPCILSEVKRVCNSKLIVFENKRSDLQCDVIINGIYGGVKSSVSVVNNVTIYNGPQYILLAPEYQLNSKHYTSNEDCKKILVSLGGSDPKELVFRILDALQITHRLGTQLDVTILIGMAFNHKDRLYQIVEREKNILVFENTSDMAYMMMRHDLAIISGGVTLYESMCIGIPRIVVSQVDHQAETASRFAKLGAVVNMGLGEQLHPEAIARGIIDTVSDFDLRSSLSKIGKWIVDGNGLQRVLMIIEKMLIP